MVLFTRTSSLVQKMQVAQRHLDLDLDGLLERLHKFHLLILDDFACVNRDREESAILFDLISDRYEHRSILLTANLPFAPWDRIFPNQAAAAVDRLVHHATIFEINTQLSLPHRLGTPPGRRRCRAGSQRQPSHHNRFFTSHSHGSGIPILDLTAVSFPSPPLSKPTVHEKENPDAGRRSCRISGARFNG